MAFRNMSVGKYPRRQWSLVGAPSAGKSTFSTQMRGPLLAIDSDHRYSEVARKALGEVYELSDNPADNMNPETIRDKLKENMPSSGVRTIVFDSLTSVISPLVVEAMLDNDAGRNKNRVSAFKDKALAMRVIQDAVTGWGVDTLWILHTRMVRNAEAKEVETKSISPVELARLRRSLNMELYVVQSGNKRGIRVDWARNGRSGMTIWDDTGNWIGMPEKIEAAVYDGLSEAEMKAMERKRPTSFTGPDTAISWAFEQGCFRDAVHAEHAYNKCKEATKPATAQAMWNAWLADVDRRVAEWATKPLVDMDSAPVLDKKLLEDENGDYLFKAPDRVAAPVRVDVTSPTADTFEDIMEAADMAEDIPFNPTPFEEFFASAIVRMTPEQVVLSDLLVYGPKDAPERIGQNDLAAVTKVAALSVKISELCGLGDDSHLSVSLGEIVLRLLFGDESGLPSDAFCIALNNAITQKDRSGRDSNRFDPNVCSVIKQLGAMVKEMCADG